MWGFCVRLWFGMPYYTRVIFYVRAVSLQILNLRYHKYIYFERSSFCRSTDINFTPLGLTLVKIFSFEKGMKMTLVEIHAILTTQQAGN